MKLSGAWQSKFGNGGVFRLRAEWSASQSISGNTSTVTVKFYLISDYSTAAIYSSQSKTMNVTLDGSSYSFSFTAGLRGNQTKHIGTVSKTIPHNTLGEKTFSMSASSNIGISGVASTISVSGSDTLKPIPRESTISSSVSWTAGSNTTITVKRASTSFTHRLIIDVKSNINGSWVNIKNINFGASTSTSFTAAEHEKIFDLINGSASADVRMHVHTYRSGTHIGYTTKTGTVTAPAATKTHTGTTTSPYVDSTVNITLLRQNSNFTHTVVVKLGSFTKTFTGVGYSTSWTPSDSEQQTLYSQMKTVSSRTGTIEITTYYGSEKVRSTTTSNITFRVRNSNPTFGTGYTHKDINTTVTAITGNDQAIVQGKSNIRVTIPVAEKAISKNQADMKNYVISFGGKSKTVNWSNTSDVYADLGSVDVYGNHTLTVKAVDSRGISTTTSKVINVTAYSPPTLRSTVTRVNSFEDSTIVTVTGALSPLMVGNVKKNNLEEITGIKYRYKQATSSVWSGFINMTWSEGVSDYASSTDTLTLDNTMAWNVEIVIADKLSVVSTIKNVQKGKPLFFLDPYKNSMGFNDLPNGENEFKVNGRIVFGANLYASAASGEGYGALYMNNSDITGVNGIWFNDAANNNGEGLLWLKSGSPIGSQVSTDYDNLRVLNGVGYLNDTPVMLDRSHQIWNGAALFMKDTQSVTPDKSLSQCPNGWILVWSKYIDGASNQDFNFTIVPKWYATLTGAGFWATLQSNRTTLVSKYLYCNNTTLWGHVNNADAPHDTMVLRYIYAF